MSDLFQRYLDGTLTPEEMAELDAILRTPEGAERFAALSRLDADLSAHFREEMRLPPLPPRRRWAARLALAASVLILAGLGVVWWPATPAWPREVVAQDKTEVELPDGSRVTFAAGARATVEPRRVTLHEGAATFDVVPGDEPFEVTTPVGRVTVVGTKFHINVGEEETMGGKKWVMVVTVMLGVVEVSYDGQTYRLGAGQSGAYGRPEAEKKAHPGARVRGYAHAIDEKKVIVGESLSFFGADRGGETYELPPDVKITVDGKPGKVTDIPKGTRITVLRDAEGTVLEIDARGEVKNLEVLTVNKRTITYKGGRGTKGKSKGGLKEDKLPERLTFVDDVEARLDGKPAKYEDLKIAAGDQISVLLSTDGKRVLIVSKATPGTVGFPAKSPKEPVTGGALRGTLGALDADGRTLSLDLRLAKDAKVTIDGKPATLKDLKEGMALTVTMSEDGVEVTAVSVAARKGKGK